MKVYRIFNRKTQKYITAGSSNRNIWHRRYDPEQHIMHFGSHLRPHLEVHTFDLVRVIE